MSFNLTLIAQAVAFALFIWFTVKFVWPPLLRAIEARQKTIADGLAAAEQGRKSLEQSAQAGGRRDRRRARARLGHRRAGREARRAGDRGSEGRAKAEGDREKAAAKAEIQQEVSRAREKLRDEVAALAVAGAEKILRREVDAKAHADLLDGIKKQL